jgi:two-component system, sensor histidine kinase and response regulator
VVISVDAKALGEKYQLCVRIEDTGIGIAPEKISSIFDKFTQAEESTTRRFGGTGLGLTICQHLITMMDGRLYVCSEEKIGSTFRFTLMLEQGREIPTHTPMIPEVALKDVRALVMDNMPIAQEILGDYLDRWEVRCDTCTTSDQALTMIKNAVAEGDPYEIALVDYRVGKLNAFQLATWIRESNLKENPTMMLLTSVGQVFASNDIRDIGFSGMFIKPIYPEQLKAAMQLLLSARRSGATLPFVTRHTVTRLLSPNDISKKITTDMFPGVRVLVAEDIKINLMLITRVLEKHGCQVTVAVNGAEAVKHAEGTYFDAIFMDCQMPEMDGFEATQCIRKMEKDSDRHTVIIALTADALVGDREKCLAAGMDDYLNKPFKQEQITEMLRTWVRKK